MEGGESGDGGAETTRRSERSERSVQGVGLRNCKRRRAVENVFGLRKGGAARKETLRGWEGSVVDELDGFFERKGGRIGEGGGTRLEKGFVCRKRIMGIEIVTIFGIPKIGYFWYGL